MTRFTVVTSWSALSRRTWFHIRIEDRESHHDFLRDKRGRALRFSSKYAAEAKAVKLLDKLSRAIGDTP